MIRLMAASKEQQEKATEYVRSWKKEVKDYFTTDYFSRLFGIQGQMVVSDYLGIEVPENKGPDGGTDIVWKGRKWDVKTEIRSCFFKRKKFVHNVHGQQISNQVDGYIFVNYNRQNGIFELCGFISKEEFLKNAKLYEGGTERARSDGTFMRIQEGGMYEIKQEYLQEFK
jgi:hypothetical protein